MSTVSVGIILFQSLIITIVLVLVLIVKLTLLKRRVIRLPIIAIVRRLRAVIAVTALTVALAVALTVIIILKV